jgi:hypothetical protein
MIAYSLVEFTNERVSGNQPIIQQLFDNHKNWNFQTLLFFSICKKLLLWSFQSKFSNVIQNHAFGA